MKKFIHKLISLFGYKITKLDSFYRATSSDYVVRNLFNKNFQLIIFDIGANIGQSAQKYSSLYKNATIFSFEPSLKEYEIMKTRDIKNFKPFNIGFSNKKTQENLFLNKISATNSLLPLSEKAGKVWPNIELKNIETITCNFDTLDNFCNDMNIKIIDFMKIDTQGSEYLVLDGAKELLSKKVIRNIQLEVILGDTYKGQKTIGYYMNLLENYGYKLKAISDITISNGSLICTDLFFTLY